MIEIEGGKIGKCALDAEVVEPGMTLILLMIDVKEKDILTVDLGLVPEVLDLILKMI